MNEERIEKLKQYLRETPDDPFLRYALAGEYVSDAPETALQLYQQLLDQHPEYLPTYYQAATLLKEKDDLETARTTFEKGIDLARKQQDLHTLRELQQAYNNLLWED